MTFVYFITGFFVTCNYPLKKSFDSIKNGRKVNSNSMNTKTTTENEMKFVSFLTFFKCATDVLALI